MDYFASYAEADDSSCDVDPASPSPLQEEEQQQQEQEQQQQQQQHLDIKLLAPLPSAPATTQGAESFIEQRKRGLIRPEETMLPVNPKIHALEAPIVGPLTPLQEIQGGLRYVYGKRLGGEVERAHLSRVAFESEYHRFMSQGVAADPSDGAAAAAAAAAEASAAPPSVEVPLRIAEFVPLPIHRSSNNSSSSKLSRKERKAQRPQRNEDTESEAFQGPWALYVHPKDAAAEAAAAAAAAAEAEGQDTAAVETTAGAATAVAAAAPKEEAAADKKTTAGATKGSESVFHGKEFSDYQGRSWLAPPSQLKPLGADASFFVPRECIHTFSGHTGGVQTIRLFPDTGHLLLSASLDSTVKIWDVYNQRKCRCTYTAHTQAVRDIQWADGGSRFYSCGYDNTIKLWDTERGKVIGTFSNNKTPYCVAVYPGDSNIFVAGCSNKRAVQYDARSGDIIVEYADHLGAVNTVTFCEAGKKVVTTADDKKMFVWEYGIPVVVKYIADPEMHSMPACCMHPSHKFLTFQALNSELVTYEAFGKYRFLPRRRFKGHLSAGYAIQPAFSPDGRYVLSGDSTGRVFFWDFKNGRNVRVLKAHSKVCMGAQWHPTSPSRVFTCGWEGLIKLWD